MPGTLGVCREFVQVFFRMAPKHQVAHVSHSRVWILESLLVHNFRKGVVVVVGRVTLQVCPGAEEHGASKDLTTW